MSGCGVPAVTFVYADWVAMFPEFAAVSQPAAQGYFNMATLYCSNKLGPVCTVEELTQLLYLLAAHVAALFSDPNNAANPSPSNTPVGRLASATEGSVSGSWDNQYPAGTPQWYQQTKYGAAYWAATAPFRTFRYRAGVRPGLSLSQIPWLYPNAR